MESKIKHLFLLTIGLYFLFGTGSLRADIVYPSKLSVVEINPGIFEITFILPIINGKVLKAQPQLPNSCSPTSEPIITGDNNSKIVRYIIKCDQLSLDGEQIGITGLMGNTIDILLEVSFLNGREFKVKLSPAKAFYIIPTQPTFLELMGSALSRGIQLILHHFGLYLLLLVVLPLMSVKRWLKSVLFFALSFGIGQWLYFNEVLVIPPHVLTLVLLICAFLLGIIQLTNPNTKLNIKPYIFLFFSIVGLMIGGSIDLSDKLLTLESINKTLFLFELSIGVFIGLGLMILLVLSLVNVLKMFKGFNWSFFLIFCLSLIMGLGLRELSLFYAMPQLIPQIPVLTFMYILISGGFNGKLYGKNKIISALALFGAFGVGLLIGYTGLEFIHSGLVVAVTILVLSVFLVFKKQLNIAIHIGILIISGLAAGHYTAILLDSTISYAIAKSVGFSFILAIIYMVMTYLVAMTREIALSKLTRKILLTMLIVPPIVLGLLALINTFIPNTILKASIGYITIPVFSILLIILGLWSWPRYKKIHKTMNLQKKSSFYSVLFIGLALIFLPYGMTINNPWNKQKNLNTLNAKEIIGNILTTTYTAFNNDDEEILFEKLSQSVSKDLLDDVYLDSRRRLTMGLREGSVVTVEKVKIESLGEPETSNDTENGITYPAQWVVTARVKHLQHIHYRNNKYTGSIKISTEDEVWKISDLTLVSEDRTVIAASNL